MRPTEYDSGLIAENYTVIEVWKRTAQSKD